MIALELADGNLFIGPGFEFGLWVFVVSGTRHYSESRAQPSSKQKGVSLYLFKKNSTLFLTIFPNSNMSPHDLNNRSMIS
jgi:hypothetical protein